MNAVSLAFTLLFLPLALAGCALEGGPAKSLPSPPNLTLLKRALVRSHESGEYEKQIAQITAAAAAYIAGQAGNVSRPALVLDIDETSLSNWPQLQLNDFAYFADAPCDPALKKSPCGSVAWDELARAPALAGTLALYETARKHHVAVFFITGRYESERAATERNLRFAGYESWEGLAMRPIGSHTRSAADFKTPERRKIANAGYTIIANVGDQPSDLDGGIAARTFLLPNPYYRID
jgi:acid phosphatase